MLRKDKKMTDRHKYANKYKYTYRENKYKNTNKLTKRQKDTHFSH